MGWLRVAGAGLAIWGAASCSPQGDCPRPASSTPGRFAVDSANAVASADVTSAPKSLTFKKLDRTVKTLELDAILKAIPPEPVTQLDPFYNREKTHRAVPLSRVVEMGFPNEQGLPAQEFVLRSLDGYTVPLRGSRVFEAGAYIAYEDLDAPGWEPIGQQRANPGPFYLVWAKKDQTSLETHPRPYKLASIEIAEFESVFPWTVPVDTAADSAARKGFAIFREQCIHCHAMNRQGGRVGPELNVPRSIVEYRPVEQIKAYIRDPQAFRYSTMPAHPKMTDADLDDVVAYFEAMKGRKHDDEKPTEAF